MLPIRTILCGIDFSEDSRQAFRAALAISSRRPAHIVVLHVVDLLLAHASLRTQGTERMTAETTSALRLFVAAEAGKGADTQTLSIEVGVGVPERELLARARGCGADLIVVGTRGISGVTKLFFGSVAEKILRRADVPVLVVPATEGSGTEAFTFSRVLAAMDLDDTSEAVATQAAAAARYLGLPLRLIHVLTPLPTGWRWLDAVQASMPIRIGHAQTRLKEIADALTVATETDVREGSAPEQVAAAAKEQSGTLLVVGLDGGTHLGRIGSTAYRIVCLSNTPVLAMPVHVPAAAGATVLTAAEAI